MLNMLKDEPVGKKIGLADQRAFSGTGRKKRVNHFWKKGQEDQENYKDAVKSCRGKTRRAKAWLELNLATELL